MGRKMLLVKIVLDTGFAWRKPIVLIQIKLPCVSACSSYKILLDIFSSLKINIGTVSMEILEHSNLFGELS